MFSALEGIGIRAPMKTNNRTSAGEAGSHVSFRWQKQRLLAAKSTSPLRSAGQLLASEVWKSRPPASAFAPCKPLEREGLLC